MNCKQARTLLSAYRELKSGTLDTSELDEHLEVCAACRETLASYAQIGDHLRSAPLLEDTLQPDVQAKLMKALADEQLKFLQKSAHGKVSTPEFLKPYLRERVQETQSEDEIAAFSTAETGPLPIIYARRKPRKVQVSQFAVLGVAASVLMLLMMGGLVSLLMLAHTNPTTTSFNRNSASLNRPTEVNQRVYTTNTLYPNVTSAIPSGNYVYYAASGTGSNASSWMLMQFDRSTQVSKPLLATPSDEPLIVFAASDTWLVWLEFNNRPRSAAYGVAPGSDNPYAPSRSWTLNYLSLLPQSQRPSAASGQTATPAVNGDESNGQNDTQQIPQMDLPTQFPLKQDTFDIATAPGWVNGPIQGAWLAGNTLLVTYIDRQGVSHLTNYTLDTAGVNVQAAEIAKAEPGHILTWPTIDSSGRQIYWANEWLSADGVLHSNIWEQQAYDKTTLYHGYVNTQSSYTQKVLMNDGMSFQPQVVDNTLFFISTSEVVVSAQGATQEPNGTPFPLTATDRSVTSPPRTDQSAYAAPTDASVHGTVFMIHLDGLEVGNESMLGTVGQSTGFQAGDNYVIWQDNTGFQMYDVGRQAEVMLGNTLDNAALLMVNGDTTLWFSADQAKNPNSKLTLMLYNWPG